MRNRMANAKNMYQGSRKKVLTVCSAGLLRSPTIAYILSNDPFNFNTRSCGASSEFALIPLDKVLVHWADEVVVVEPWMLEAVHEFDAGKIVHIIPTPDIYECRSEELIAILTPKLKEIFKL